MLTADDDPQILRALRITLGARGYDIVTAGDGKAALNAAIEHHPDLVMLDLGMPNLDGISVIAPAPPTMSRRSTPEPMTTSQSPSPSTNSWLASAR